MKIVEIMEPMNLKFKSGILSLEYHRKGDRHSYEG